MGGRTTDADMQQVSGHNPGYAEVKGHPWFYRCVHVAMGDGTLAHSVGEYGPRKVLAFLPVTRVQSLADDAPVPEEDIDPDGLSVLVTFQTIEDVQRVQADLSKIADMFTSDVLMEGK